MDTSSTAPRRYPFLRAARAATLGAVAGALITIGAAAATEDEPSDPAADATWSGDTKDHPGYGPATTAWTGDTKDHPGYGPATTAWTGDSKDHPGYGPVNLAASTAAGEAEAFCQAAS